MNKRARTRARLSDVALELFERHGFEQTTVAQIAAAADVTEMTFFRHFPAKHQVLFEDPYDEFIADAVAAQPGELGPLRRAAGGLREAWARVPEPDGDTVRRRVRIVAGTPSLRGEMWRNNAATERLVSDQLIADGARPLRARAAAAAVLAAVTAALLEWSVSEDAPLGDAVLTALDTLEGGDE
ncbi:TetR/AcrR family transcriptional regulator [Streptomyces ovatisporus]|uniref:TetR/AcrR family transcriptional regulator n=1 Tax=Streptomyces ovatisporus TaxID=1128682 RepID=A0ABV9ABK9_9ACTN